MTRPISEIEAGLREAEAAWHAAAQAGAAWEVAWAAQQRVDALRAELNKAREAQR